MNPVEVQDYLIELLRATDIPSVWEETVPAGQELPKQNKVYLPYALVSFGGAAPVAGWQQGITSSKDDLKWTSIAVECVGATPRSKRLVAQIVRDTFEGLIPDPSWGQLREQLSDSYTVKVPDFDLWPVRFATGIVFNTQMNARLEN